MCSLRRFAYLGLILHTLISHSFGFKIANFQSKALLEFVNDGKARDLEPLRAFRLNSEASEQKRVTDFFADVFSNPAYEQGIKVEKKNTEYHTKNSNLLKNLGRAHYEGVLYQIQNTINGRLEGEKDSKSAKGRRKGPEVPSEEDKEVMSAINDLKRSILYNSLQRIAARNNLPSERILRTKDFVDGMHYRRMGESDFAVSQLCIGTSMYDNPELIDADHAVEIMDTALNRYGINFYDTCEYDPYPYEPRSYLEGHHKTLKEFLKLEGRENVILSGRISSSNLGKYKTSGRFLSWVRDDIRSPPSLKTIEGAVDKLLASLGTDYLDILSFVHPYRYVPQAHLGEDTYCWAREGGDRMCEEGADTDLLDLQVDALNELVSKGKVRSVGLSNESTWGLYQMKYHKNRKFKLVCTQALYNLLHRNEAESSGLVEASLKEHFNCPIVAYGALAGGILTGKYLDPERFNPMGADKIREVSNFAEAALGPNFEIPEDYGHLSYGPSNARCNLFPETYHTHRTVWCQHATAEYLKVARTFGLSLSQMALAWCFSRPFIASTIVAPRSIGQLHESIAALNYPFSPELEDDVHEIFLRYRAPTMGGPQLLTRVGDDLPIPMSQNDLLKHGPVPIWSGGSHWDMDHIPSMDRLMRVKHQTDQFIDVKRVFGLLDKPNDSNWPNYRCWVERINEGLPGEYFAVKESKLFSWDTMKLEELTLVNKTPEEVKRDDTSDFHFYWKGGKVHVAPTSEAIYNFYKDKEAQYNVIKQREDSFRRGLGKDLDENSKIWSPVDADLVYKRLMAEHGINVLDERELEETLLRYSDALELTPEEQKCEKFAYFNKHIHKYK